ATIGSITIENGQLVIQSDRSLRDYSTGWDRATTAYQLTLPNTRLGDATAPPIEGAPLLRVDVEQAEDETVVIRLLPTAGTQFGELNSSDEGVLVLPLGADTARAPIQSIPVPAARPAPTVPTAPIALPQVNDGRVIITIDPGHGGRDPGAIGVGGLRETDIVLPISLRVAELLEAQGVSVLLTRRDEREIGLEPRVDMANRGNADVFVSIHANAISMSRPDVNGVETYYASNAGLQLARIIHASVISGTGMNDRGVREAGFHVLRHTNMPAVLVETGFVTGASDAARLSDPNFRNRMAEAIARGILQYVQQYVRASS
ncbi:MAG: N-acetylmuramoyl-L-alanine amidase, partial [Microcoleus sp. SIO2G3]|nr:N-acetylmuramoyl-L-alanine amidase [Microcoleus sp. SIO2G3]